MLSTLLPPSPNLYFLILFLLIFIYLSIHKHTNPLYGCLKCCSKPFFFLFYFFLSLLFIYLLAGFFVTYFLFRTSWRVRNGWCVLCYSVCVCEFFVKATFFAGTRNHIHIGIQQCLCFLRIMCARVALDIWPVFCVAYRLRLGLLMLVAVVFLP